MVENKFKKGDTVKCIKIPDSEDFKTSSCCEIVANHLKLNEHYIIDIVGRKNSISFKNLHYYPAHCFTNILTETTIELW